MNCQKSGNNQGKQFVDLNGNNFRCNKTKAEKNASSAFFCGKVAE